MKRESGQNPLQPTVTVKLMKPASNGILQPLIKIGKVQGVS